jgi:hypothetical protein
MQSRQGVDTLLFIFNAGGGVFFLRGGGFGTCIPVVISLKKSKAKKQKQNKSKNKLKQK